MVKIPPLMRRISRVEKGNVIDRTELVSVDNGTLDEKFDMSSRTFPDWPNRAIGSTDSGLDDLS